MTYCDMLLQAEDIGWPEDWPHENGKYLCHCRTCGRSFFGHKRRQTCKKCSNASVMSVAENTKKDLACDQKPVKVVAIFDGHRWQLVSTRPVEIAIVTCLSGQEKPRPVTVANIQPVVDMATFRETVHDKLAALTQSGQIDLRQLAEFTK